MRTPCRKRGLPRPSHSGHPRPDAPLSAQAKHAPSRCEPRSVPLPAARPSDPAPVQGLGDLPQGRCPTALNLPHDRRAVVCSVNNSLRPSRAPHLLPCLDQAAGVVSAHQVGSAGVRVRGAMSLRHAGCRTGKQEHRGRRDCAQPHALTRSKRALCRGELGLSLVLRAVDRGRARPFGVFGGRATSGRPCGPTRGVPRLTTSAVASHSIGPRAGAYRQVGSSNCAGKRSRSRRCPNGCGSQPGHRP